MGIADATGPTSSPEEENSGSGFSGRKALDIIGAGAGFLLGRNQGAPGEGVQLGYQGEIPDYNLIRERVLDTSDPNMRPGAAGKRYFSDYRYMPSSDSGIAGVRQDLFNQANVGPNSLRAQNYTRQGLTERPALQEGAGPTGINTVVGAPFDYSQRGGARGESKSYTMADVTDSTKVQYYNDGTIYVPNYGFVNLNDPATMAQFAESQLPGLRDEIPAGEGDPPAGDPPAGDPPAGDPPAGDPPAGDPPAGEADPGNNQPWFQQPNGRFTIDSPEFGLYTDLTQSGLDTLLEEFGLNNSPSREGLGIRPFDNTELTKSAFDIIKANNGDTNNDNYISADEWTNWTFNKGPTASNSEEWARRIEATRKAGGLDASIMDAISAPDANGLSIGTGNLYADNNDAFAFEYNGGTTYTPMVFREGGKRALSVKNRTAVQEAAQAIINDPDASISGNIISSTYNRSYFDYLLNLAGKKFTPNGAKAGGDISLAGGGYLGGSTDGMADQINTSIDGQQPAALSDGEFVLPADVVSHLGNGNSSAGADMLYSMMSDIRKDRTGTTKQGTQIDPNSYLPSRGIA